MSTWVSPIGYAFCDDCRREHSSPKPILAGLLGDVEAHLKRFVVFPNEHGSAAVTLWIAATHIVPTLDVAPYLLVTAPEIESGKTRLLEVAAPLCHEPIFSSSMTPAVLFRVIDAQHPTLFLDEADNIWTRHGDEKNAELVALLNAGHRRGMKARRMGGPGKTTLEEFDVFGPKAIAGAFPDITRIPEALRSRSIHLRMHRKLPGETVNRWTRQTRDTWRPDLETIRGELSDQLHNTHPADTHIAPLDELGDRDFDVWEPLLQIAAAAGPRWARTAIDAAVALCSQETDQTIPARLLALRDLKDIWNGKAFMLTADILNGLHNLEDRPWNDYYGAPLTARRLGGFLSSYSIESKTEPRDTRRKGYYSQDLTDTWQRYAPETSQTSPTSPTNVNESIESIERLPHTQPGTHNASHCRCGNQVDHYTPTGYPFCETCGPPHAA